MGFMGDASTNINTKSDATAHTRHRLTGVHGRTYAREQDAIIKEVATTYARTGDAQARFSALANAAKTNTAADAFFGSSSTAWAALFTSTGARVYAQAYPHLSAMERGHALPPTSVTQDAWDCAATAAAGLYGSALQERPAAALVSAFLLKTGSARILGYGHGLASVQGDVVFTADMGSASDEQPNDPTEAAFLKLPLEERKEWQRRAAHEIFHAASRALWHILDAQFGCANPNDAAEFAALRCGADETPDAFALRFK